MTTSYKAAVCLSLTLAVAITGCKPKPPAAPAEVPAAATSAPAPTVAITPAAAPVAPPPPAAAAAVDAAGADLDKIAVITKPLPPFPFIDYPAAVGQAFQETKESDFDQLHVIVGRKMHTVEGRFKLTAFDLRHAKISQFQAQRDYAKAVTDMGGVKVNSITPEEEAFVEVNGGDRYQLLKKMKYETQHSYDVYFLPTASGRKWIVLMIDDDDVSILAIEEKTTESSVKVAAPAV